MKPALFEAFSRCWPRRQRVTVCRRNRRIVGRRAGPATLRNAYMARQIRKGYPLDLIRDWTGLRTIEQLRALQRQVPIRGDGLKPV